MAKKCMNTHHTFTWSSLIHKKHDHMSSWHENEYISHTTVTCNRVHFACPEGSNPTSKLHRVVNRGLSTICIFNADCTHWFRYSLSLATACSYLRSSSCISRLKTTMYSPSIAVGVSTLNRGAVQWKKEKDAAKELNLKACNAWKLLDRQTFQVFAVCKCAGCNSENDSCNLHVWIPRETAE